MCQNNPLSPVETRISLTRRIIDGLLLGLIVFYQKGISPHTPPSCRYIPTCSEYARLSISRHGWIYGLWLTGIRLSRCHPFHPGGNDPVAHHKPVASD